MGKGRINMLGFQNPPDKIFTEIIDESIKLMIDHIREIEDSGQDEVKAEEAFQCLFPFACRVFNRETALHTLGRMLQYNKRPGLYRLNDYHYLLLYDTLQNLCDIHNDMVRDAPDRIEKKKASKIGSFYIEKINFDDLLSVYFFDLDFLIDAETMFELGSENRNHLGINNETFGISQEMAPHPEELIMTLQEKETPALASRQGFWCASSRVYPDVTLNKHVNCTISCLKVFFMYNIHFFKMLSQ